MSESLLAADIMSLVTREMQKFQKKTGKFPKQIKISFGHSDNGLTPDVDVPVAYKIDFKWEDYEFGEWVECWNCDEGYSGHDCGEDCCCCLDPEDNVICDICRGKGGWIKASSKD